MQKILTTALYLCLIFISVSAGRVGRVCFEPNTMILTPKGQIPVSTLSQGDFVITHKNKASKVLKIYYDQDTFEFMKIHTNVGFLEVTPDHLMISKQKLVQAKRLKVGQYIGLHQITQIELTKKYGRISIFTSDGSVIANGMPTTTICGEYEELSVDEGLQKWVKEHKELDDERMILFS